MQVTVLTPGRRDLMLSADEVASVIIARSGTWLDAMSLQKLLYYVQAWHVAITDEPLFDERFKAWKDGPVVPQVWHARRDQGTRRPSAQNVDSIEVDELASDLIDLVLATYGSMSGEELSALTHVEQPWLDARGDLPADAPSSEPISLQAMAEFYRSRRVLGGRTAADLAAAGIHLRSNAADGPLDVDELLASLDSALADPGDDAWGGANLGPVDGYDTDGIETRRRRAHTGT